MTKHFFLLILCFCTIIKADAQKKDWQIVAFTNDSKAKGVLKEANDSSLVLLTKSGEQTLSFNEISRLKFIRTKNKAIKIVSGVVVGASLGAAITASQLSKGKAGEPAALSSAIGVTLGGFAGGIAGGFIATPLFKLVFARRINVEHSLIFYQSLPQKLQPYLAK